jgi:hypothetical protein
MLQALMDWVEKGAPPRDLVMHRGADRAKRLFAADTTREIGVAVGQSNGTSRDFRVCPYPLVSVFDRAKAQVSGAVYDAKNWSCQLARTNRDKSSPSRP